jgi:hypothetical protein
MNLFEKQFLHLLEADEEGANQDITDKAAMTQQLDKGTNPADFNTQVPAGIEQAKQGHLQAQKASLQEWIVKISEFIEYMNGVDPASIQSQLQSGGCESLFEKVASSEKKRIARVAMELSALNEALKGYLISGDA